ncbi:MAG TPA: 4-(cytidine 5'-diphospho)-2-C-methyl-D-erythritol kinase [Lacibacter sp.]|nr:4-(cytidine 5'-diphospho)-2-C-methyl-D-erythritol kinase [Lacibacter sp.]HMO90244.1 4-(cytidine 5'-diphospho)-2-C-methyl-D-erythritol kinase [Lacibacter sp.]HMP88168.1 4-(cytidine 5'-diphospho)-2-C-methyl-D-erythritol kinase [Lacibacter sp.]
MLVFPNCKINLGLLIRNKREDGFHNLQTIFYPIPLTDAVEIIRRPDSAPGPTVTFSASGREVAGDPTNNLCIRAYELLKKDFPTLPPVLLHLHKVIPMGAGLGGGSSDGAFVLRLLNEQFQLNCTAAQLEAYALQLGSDCPFFIRNQPCFASGRGEILEPLELDLSAYRMALVHPGIHVNTGWAFRQLNRGLTPEAAAPDLREIVRHPVTSWKGRLYNDFEAPVTAAYPVIGGILQSLYDAGAVYAAMSGSGSTVYGLFDETPVLSFPPHYFYIIL